jgi:hypothetical protein
VTINLANQKNGKKNAKLYYTHSGDDDFSLTKAVLVRLVTKYKTSMRAQTWAHTKRQARPTKSQTKTSS